MRHLEGPGGATWLTVRQVAERLNCSQSHVYNFMERGDLAAHWRPVLGLVHVGTRIDLPARDRSDGPLARHAARHYGAALRD